MLEAALSALLIVFDPARLGIVALGVAIGLSLGVIPGLSGIVGLSLLLPFTFDMDPFTALAFLVGLQAVVATSDTIPAVLFGVPGTVGSASTILDGHPMAKQGLAARAFGAAFSASVLGGLLGALFLAFSIPLLRPFILSFGSPELLAFCIFGLSLIGVLSGGNPLKGLAAAGIGLMVATVGEEPNTAIERWTFGSLYLLEGIPLVPLALGLFALPEIADMAIARKRLSRGRDLAMGWGQLAGVQDTFRNLFLVLRGSGIGSVLGAVPGIGAPVIPWISYGHAMRTEKGAAETFGKGDVRGVIASESSNNAKEGGALVSTIAFGVPATAAMALLLGAFLIHGLAPGPDMLTSRLDVTYTLVWTVALANVLGCAICLVFARQFAAVARIRPGILAPVVLSITFIGAFQATRQWGDLVALLGFGVLGWVMKRVDWPRPPLLLGLVLGGLLERYMFISFQRYGAEWLTRPIVVVVLLVTAYSLLKPVAGDLLRRRRHARSRLVLGFKTETIDAAAGFNATVILFFAAAIIGSWNWDFGARLVPQVVGWLGLALAGWQLAWRTFVNAEVAAPGVPIAGEAARVATGAVASEAAGAAVDDAAGAAVDDAAGAAVDDAAGAAVDDAAGAAVSEAAGVATGEVDSEAASEAVVVLAGPRVFDASSDLGDLDPQEARRRALRYFAWCLFILAAALVIGLLPAMLVFLIGYLRFEGRERWVPTLSVALGTWAAAYGLFHLLLRVPWPAAWLGDLLPVLRSSGLTNLL